MLKNHFLLYCWQFGVRGYATHVNWYKLDDTVIELEYYAMFTENRFLYVVMNNKSQANSINPGISKPFTIQITLIRMSVHGMGSYWQPVSKLPSDNLEIQIQPLRYNIKSFYYTSPEICLYKSNTLDWYVIPRDKIKI